MKKGHELVHEIQQTAAVFGRSQDAFVVFEGDGGQASTDGKEIRLPSLPDNLEFSHEETMTMRGLLDHEAGHIRHTDFEAWKAFRETQSEQAGVIANCLEDMRLENLVMKEYPGSQKNLHTMRETTGEKELEYIKDNAEDFTTITAAAVQNAILRAGALEYTGEVNKAMYDMMPDRFKAWGHKFADEAKACKNTSEVLNLALAVEKLLEESTLNQPPKPMPEDSKDEEGGGSGLDGDPNGFEFDKDGDPTGGKPRKAREERGGNPLDSQGKKMLSDIIKEVKNNIQSKTDGFMKAGNPIGTDYRVLSTRWDEVITKTSKNKRQDYRKNLLENSQAFEYEKVRAELGGLVNTMKAKLRRALMAKETRDWDYGREFGKLDTKRLVAGFVGSPSVYKQRKDRLELDTAVHFLIDLSGSMRNRKIQVARESVVAFCECLEGTQIKYQVSGFDNGDIYGIPELVKLCSGAGRSGSSYHRYEPLNIFKFKSFNQSLQLAKGPISTINQCSSGNNSDRDAVIWAYHELKDRPEKRKILFVLSDGQPANGMINVRSSFGRDPLIKGLKDAIDSCGRSGVECVGVGILTEHVNSIYPKSVSINRVEDLSGAIFTQLSNLLTGGKVRF